MASSAREAFRYPNFRYFMSARVLNTTASEMQAVAVGWQIYSLTHRPLDLGLVGLAQFAPGILLFLIAGHAADRFPRQRILQVCCGGFALCSLLLLTLTLRGLHAVWPIYAVLLLNGVVRSFNGPASQAFLPLLVPVEHFPNAVTWGSSIFQGAMVFGPTLGGAIYGFAASPIPGLLLLRDRFARRAESGDRHPAPALHAAAPGGIHRRGAGRNPLHLA